jgi:hypothetical protein
MTPAHASIELYRQRLRAALGQGDIPKVKFLLGMIVGFRICTGEIIVKLKPPIAI